MTKRGEGRTKEERSEWMKQYMRDYRRAHTKRKRAKRKAALPDRFYKGSFELS